jgi:hypothetical protein
MSFVFHHAPKALTLNLIFVYILSINNVMNVKVIKFFIAVYSAGHTKQNFNLHLFFNNPN